jgi:lysyl-tRNA synthetase class 2
MLEIVEPSLPKNSFCILNHYPAAVSPLSKPIPGTTQAERFEIYFNGIELCNGCTELTDEQILKARYKEESQERKNSSKLPHLPPTKLFESALKITNYSGVAIGLERLFFILESLKSF